MTAAPTGFDLTDIAVPRVVTPGYRFPPAVPTNVPPAHECSDEQLLDLCAGAANWHDHLLALMGSPDHVAAICRLVERLDIQRLDWRAKFERSDRALASTVTELHEERRSHTQTIGQMAAQLRESIGLAQRLDEKEGKVAR